MALYVYKINRFTVHFALVALHQYELVHHLCPYLALALLEQCELQKDDEHIAQECQCAHDYKVAVEAVIERKIGEYRYCHEHYRAEGEQRQVPYIHCSYAFFYYFYRE